MKPRHVAALSLLGWYLMVPPRSWVMGEKGLISDWTILQGFDSADDCERFGQLFMKRYQNTPDLKKLTPLRVSRQTIRTSRESK